MGTKIKEKAEVVCPWCTKGKTRADRLAEVVLTCQCRVCGNYYHADMKTLRTTRSRPPTRSKTL